LARSSRASVEGVKRPLALRLTRRHAWIFCALLVGFSVLTFWMVNGLLTVNEVSDGSERARRVAWTTAATVLGPFTGAIARDGQSCCAGFSWRLFPFAAAMLAAGFAAQLVQPTGRWRERLRLSAWGLGWFGWLAAGIVSFLHALE